MSELLQESKSLNFLKSNGLSDWLFYEDKLTNFFNWFQNITDENICTKNELANYEQLQREKNILHGNELECELNSLAKNFPNLLTYTDMDVRKYERELEEVQATEKFYEEIISEIQDITIQASEDVAATQSKIVKIEADSYKLQQNCLLKAKQLQEQQTNNTQSLNELNHCISKPQVPTPIFIYQMPMDKYYQHCDAFTSYSKVYLNQKFSNVVDPDEKIAQIAIELEDLRERLNNAHYDTIFETTSTQILGKIVTKLENTQPKPMSYDEMNNKLYEMSVAKEQLQVHLSVASDNLQELIKQYVDQDIQMIAFENNKEKSQRVTNRIEQLKDFAKLVSDSLLNAEITWILLQFDMERIRERNEIDMLEQKHHNPISSVMRIQTMETMLKPINEHFISNHFSKELFSLLSNHIQKNNLNLDSGFLPITTLLNEYDKFSGKIKMTFNELINGKCHRIVHIFMKELHNIETQLNRIVVDGPTNQPILWNSYFIEKLFNLQKMHEQSRGRLVRIKSDYSNNYRKRIEMDKFWQRKHLLWIMFLTNPGKLLLDIKDIQNEAQEATRKPVVAKNRLVSGIRRH